MISKILKDVANSEAVELDRWRLKVISDSKGKPKAKPEAKPEAKLETKSETKTEANRKTKPTPADIGRVMRQPLANFPSNLNVLNNYFSLGVDAEIALDFHIARKANPNTYNSRESNMAFYAARGLKNVWFTKWANLSSYITVKCTHKDDPTENLTQQLIKHNVHAVLFLNIPSYGGGTRPWSTYGGKQPQKTDDRLIEVIGLTTNGLPLLQLGFAGISIAQCTKVFIQTNRTIAMQVDGEPFMLEPSKILLYFHKSSSILRNVGKTDWFTYLGSKLPKVELSYLVF